VHRNYVHDVDTLLAANVNIRGLAHITGGGMVDNIPRVLPENINAIIQRGTWEMLPIFEMIQEIGAVDEEEMYRVFNMGIGMVVIVSSEQAELVKATISDIYQIGHIVNGQNTVIFEG
jgi:phosphoribosylformylglycinamidine cyclo-ligase